MARVLVTCALLASVVALGGVHSAAAQTFRYEVPASPGMSIAALPHANYDPASEPRHTTSNFLRPHYGSFECATDDGREYRWPCSRPGSHH